MLLKVIIAAIYYALIFSWSILAVKLISLLIKLSGLQRMKKSRRKDDEK